ncbi:hypothetical protein [Mycoplana rhizolycopersici]|uniref:Uncharacterized protein n=1 Tax=Mycoplana rhizolycopersici TaxID=2746702 RepID=A0ABX2QEB9_9HYPH|nr:hypothetical protein [Rhizobium rhizolycopersici]NVP56095.1 hypothetical protein [Rhizobium rhizolycopersici]
MTSHLAHAMRRGLMGPGHIRNLEAALGKRAGALSDAEKGQARANIGAGVLAGFRNKVINGDFDIWQRGPSRVTSGAGAGSMAADRWRHTGNFTGTSITWSQNAFTLGQIEVPGNPRYFFRAERTATGANIASLQHRVESVRTLAGLKATLTFFARGTAGKQIALTVGQVFGSGGASSAEVTAFQQTFALNAAWTKYQYVIDLPSIIGKVLGPNGDDFLSLDWAMAAAQGNMVFDIAHVSLVGDDASAERDPFTPRHVGQELALCQRYFFRSYDWQGGHAIRYGTAGSLRDGGVLPFPVTMRASPTTTIVVTPAFLNCSAPVWGLPNLDMAALRLTVTATGDYRAWGGEYHFDAEL